MPHFSFLLAAALGLAVPSLSVPVPQLSLETADAIQAFQTTVNVVIADIVDSNIPLGVTDFETAYGQLRALAPADCDYGLPVIPGSAEEVIGYLQTAQLDMQTIEQDMINGDQADADEGLCAVQAAFEAIATLESQT